MEGKKMRFGRVIAIISLIAFSLSAFAVPAFAAEAEPAAESWFRLSNILPIAIALALVVFVIIFFFVIPKRREKSVKFFRGLKSECKKVSWYSWGQTVRGSVVVAVIAVAIALIVGLLDAGFSQGLIAITELFK
jgi:preprotein translocase SecE subunit